MAIAWTYLFLAGLFEIGFTTCLKLSDSFTKWLPSLLFTLFAAMSFWLLTKAIAHIPLGTAYAVWTGIGAFGTAMVGIFFFHEPVTTLRIVLLLVLIGSIIGLKLASAG